MSQNKKSNPKSNQKLIQAAFAGILAAGLMSSANVFAQTTASQVMPSSAVAHAEMHGDKAGCKTMAGCKGMADKKADKASCKGAAGCKGMADKKADKASCKGAAGCKTAMPAKE